jgi:hypothetical protein
MTTQDGGGHAARLRSLRESRRLARDWARRRTLSGHTLAIKIHKECRDWGVPRFVRVQ